MEHEPLSRLIPDGVDEREAHDLDATWRMLGALDAPSPDSERMRARIDAVIEAIESEPRVLRPSRWQSHALQGLAAAAVLVIGIGIDSLMRLRNDSSALGSGIADRTIR